MRYVRKQMTIQVIADEQVEDKEAIRTLLQNFHKARTDISISYRRDAHSMLTSHERVRINLVSEDTFDLTVINSTHSLVVKKVPIENIDYISSTVSPSEIFMKKETVNKGDTLDLS